MPYAILSAIILVVGGVLLFFGYFQPQRRLLQQKSAEIDAERARLARETETRRKELLLEARDEAHRLRDEVEREVKEKRSELQRLERKLAQREDALDEKLSSLDAQREALAIQERAAQHHMQEAWDLKEQQKATLERLGGLSSEEARTLLLRDVEGQARMDAARLMHQIEEEAKAEGDKRARGILTLALQ
ncbi:MAG: DUF3552 domain-containing protein, partial [Armatimonadetes bacterium]|nr:DUF3552 domain-containing protein [Armatimonadota bacterium]